MSYYRPSFSQTIAMTRGRGGYSPRGSPYRGSNRGSRGSYGPPRGFSSFDSRSKYSDRYSGSRSSKFDDYRKPFRSETYSSRDRSPDRKKPRIEGYSSRHDSSYGGSGSYGSRYESNFSERRSYSGERSMTYPRREEFRRPSGPPISSRGGYRGRGSSRGSRILRPRERLPPRRRMLESSYGIRKRIISSRVDYSRRLKISKLRSSIAAARRAEESDEENDSEVEKDDKKDSDKEDNEEGSVQEKKSPKKEKDDADKHDDKPASDDGRPKKIMIKLNCPHCNVKCITFRKYEMHLSSRMHMVSMKRVAMKQKAILSQMRQAQRSAQNELEKTSNEDLQGRTLFCPLCKLNYKQKKSVHQVSEAHKNMKKFLMPFCKVCSVTFRSPMIYESHCCSIEHLKRKQRMENEASDSNEEADLENFTTIDSVGDVDEEETEKKVEAPKEIVSVGIEKIRKVEAHYCDLCKIYLPRAEESEMPKLVSKHCKMLMHMKRYVRYKEDKDLAARAQKLQKKETAEKEEKAKKAKDEESEEESKKHDKDAMEVTEDNEVNKSIDEEENKEDKMWADVDKDLGDILADAEDDDEEDSSAKTKERYDRFKLSEKNGEENLKDGKDGEKIANGESEDVKEES